VQAASSRIAATLFPTLLLLTVAAGSAPASVRAAGPDWVPASLQPWVGWVLHDDPDAGCPRRDGAGERVCVFPASLTLSIDDAGAQFQIVAAAYLADAELPVPGRSGAWPQDVEMDGKAVPVVSAQGVPQVRLPSGSHHIAGRIEWRRMPGQITIPEGYASLSVTLRGQAVRADDAGVVWLARSGARTAEADTSNVRIFREVVDEVPAIVETAIELTVAGKPREITVPLAQLPGFTALQLRGSLPMRLNANDLHVQAAPGKYWLFVKSHRETPLADLAVPASAAPEVWSFAAVNEVRRVEVQGPASVDPRQADVPQAWQQLPAWRMKPGDALRVAERHRGDPGDVPNRLTLSRIIWLDQEGSGFTFRDHLAGTISSSQGGAPDAKAASVAWRLQMGAPLELGRASLNGEDQFLTRTGQDPSTGFELRTSQVEIQADGRSRERSSSLPIAGWSTDLQGAATKLIVPPGWRLVHASGVEHAGDSWTGRWTLWDLFLALLICFATARVFGTPTAAVLACALVLSWKVPGSPGWIWLLPIIAAGIQNAVGESARVGRWAHIARRTGLALVGVAIVWFSVGEIRGALHPVLEDRAAAGSPEALGFAMLRQEPAPKNAPELRGLAMLEMKERARRAEAEKTLPESAPALKSPQPSKLRIADSIADSVEAPAAPAISSSGHLDAVDPTAKIQTGPGVPDWEWRSYSLQWSGPVKADQKMRLWLAPPWLVRIGNLVTVALLLGALWMMAGKPRLRRNARSKPDAGAPSPGLQDPAPTTPAGVTLLLGATILASLAMLPAGRAFASERDPGTGEQARIPSPEWEKTLKELRDRLLAPPRCAPSCTGIPRLSVLARGDVIELRVVVDSQVDAAVVIPGGAAWRSARNELDGRSGEFASTGHGQTAVRVGPGVHLVVRTLAASGANEVPVEIPTAPASVDSRLEGWQLSGVNEDGTSNGTLNLVRVRRASLPGGAGPAAGTTDIAPLSRIERTLRLGLAWQIETRVERMDAGSRPQEVAIALLPDEAVTTPAIKVAGRVAYLTMMPGASASLHSELHTRDRITLEAGRQPGQMEVWTLQAASMWSVTLGGTPPVSRVNSGVWSPQWRPWPGESTTLAIARPEGAAGETLTVDSVELTVQPGESQTNAQAEISLRASLGGTHRFELPQGARIVSLKKDGQALPAYAEGRSVPMLVEPGVHKLELGWREERGMSNAYTLPQLGLGKAAVNASLVAAVPHDRWLLLAWGPTMGPVVLYWSMLVVLALVAVGLSRVIRSPLSVWSWLALAIGAGQDGVGAALTVLAFVAVVSAREQWGKELASWKFNGMQVGAALFGAIAIAVLLASVHNGLLGRPSMLVVGGGSSDLDLHWYQDRVDGLSPAATMISLPLWVWRIAMLAWSVWLALTVTRIAGWVWAAFGTGGRWKRG
jgi:hypothetical protein